MHLLHYHPATTTSPPSASPASRVFQSPDNNDYRVYISGGLEAARHILLEPQMCTRRPCSLQRFSVKTDVDSSTARLRVIGVGVNLESFASVKACASQTESLDRLNTTS